MSTYKILGISDECTTCDNCGKTNLKCTVALENVLSGEIVRFGRDCASRALTGSKKNMKVIETNAKVVSLIHKWLAAGHAPQVVVKGIAMRFGYPIEYRNNTIRIQGICEIPA